MTNIAQSTYETSINQKTTIRTTPRTLKTKLLWVPILVPKLRKEFKNTLKLYSHWELKRSPSCVKISQNFYLILTRAFTH